MLSWFRKAKPKGRHRAASDSSPLDEIPLKALEITIVTTSLLSTGPINDAWTSVTGEDSMSWKSNLAVRTEMLFFFLHMLNRYAFDAGGADVRDTLQDAILENAIRGAIMSSFDSSHAREGFDVKGWKARMLSSTLEAMNGAELDYSSCTGLFAESGVEAFLRGESIVGKLAARIAREVGQEHNPALRLLIGKTAIEALAKSGLREQVEMACKVLR